MTFPVTFQPVAQPAGQPAAPAPTRTAPAEPAKSAARPARAETSDIGQRFEQMLWTEMLTYAGLDKAFSQGGGEAASSFSRYVVESIAKDLSETHPMGLADSVERSVAARQSMQASIQQDEGS